MAFYPIKPYLKGLWPYNQFQFCIFLIYFWVRNILIKKHTSRYILKKNVLRKDKICTRNLAFLASGTILDRKCSVLFNILLFMLLPELKKKKNNRFQISLSMLKSHQYGGSWWVGKYSPPTNVWMSWGKHENLWLNRVKLTQLEAKIKSRVYLWIYSLPSSSMSNSKLKYIGIYLE